MDLVGKGTADYAASVDLQIQVVVTDLNGFVDNLTVVQENLFQVDRVREVWVLGELRAAFVADHFTDKEVVAILVVNDLTRNPERYGWMEPAHVGVHKNVSLYSYPLGPRSGVLGKYHWEGR